MTHFKSALASTIAAILVASTLGSAAVAGDWKFEVINKSKNKVLSFQTNENGSWSKNWLGENIAPGETFIMNFGTAEGECTVRTHITFNDDTHVDGDVDYCKVSTLIINNDGVSLQ